MRANSRVVRLSEKAAEALWAATSDLPSDANMTTRILVLVDRAKRAPVAAVGFTRAELEKALNEHRLKLLADLTP